MLMIPNFMKRLTDGFHERNLHTDFLVPAEWEVPTPTELFSLLNQPFHYLGKGSQCYVFESHDQKYVLKLFRFFRPENHLTIFTLLHAAHIAYESLQQETGLIYIHLNPTALHLPTVCCKDALGRSHHLRLDEYRFAVQKKAIPLEETLKQVRHDPQKLQQRVNQFIDLLTARTEKGIFNTDPSLEHNFGFLEDRAIEIDFGCFRPVSTLSKEEEKERYLVQLRSFLNRLQVAM